MILLGAAILYFFTLVGFLWLLATVILNAANERENQSVSQTELLVLVEENARLERDALLERIQRPEQRPAIVDENPPPTPEPVEMDMGMVGAVVSEASEEPEVDG